MTRLTAKEQEICSTIGLYVALSKHYFRTRTQRLVGIKSKDHVPETLDSRGSELIQLVRSRTMDSPSDVGQMGSR